MNSEEIWIAEDDLDDLELYTEVLSKLGTGGTVRHFTDGSDVLKAVHNAGIKMPRVLLLSIRMPILSGLDVVKALKREGLADCTRMIILGTTFSDANQIEADKMGIEIIEKPVNMAALTRLFKKLIEGTPLTPILAFVCHFSFM